MHGTGKRKPKNELLSNQFVVEKAIASQRVGWKLKIYATETSTLNVRLYAHKSTYALRPLSYPLNTLVHEIPYAILILCLVSLSYCETSFSLQNTYNLSDSGASGCSEVNKWRCVHILPRLILQRLVNKWNVWRTSYIVGHLNSVKCWTCSVESVGIFCITAAFSVNHFSWVKHARNKNGETTYLFECLSQWVVIVTTWRGRPTLVIDVQPFIQGRPMNWLNVIDEDHGNTQRDSWKLDRR